MQNNYITWVNFQVKRATLCLGPLLSSRWCYICWPSTCKVLLCALYFLCTIVCVCVCVSWWSLSCHTCHCEIHLTKFIVRAAIHNQARRWRQAYAGCEGETLVSDGVAEVTHVVDKHKLVVLHLNLNVVEYKHCLGSHQGFPRGKHALKSSPITIIEGSFI